MEELDKLPKQKYTKLFLKSIKKNLVNKENKIVEKEYIDELLDDKFLSSYFDKVSIKKLI